MIVDSGLILRAELCCMVFFQTFGCRNEWGRPAMMAYQVRAVAIPKVIFMATTCASCAALTSMWVNCLPSVIFKKLACKHQSFMSDRRKLQ